MCGRDIVLIALVRDLLPLALKKLFGIGNFSDLDCICELW